PENKDAYILLGNIYMDNGQIEEAFRLFSKMVNHFPDSYAAYFFLGKIHKQKKNFTDAEKEFLKSIELKKDLVEPRFELISIYKSNQTKSNQTKSNQTKSNQTTKKNREQKIIALYEEILKIEKNNIKAAIELPLYLYKIGEKSKASEMFTNFGQRYHNNDAMMTAMARELINNQNKNDTTIVLTEVLKSDPDNSTMNYLAGLTFDSLKESQKALSHFLKVTPDSEQYKKTVFHIAYIYSQLKQTGKSIEFLETKLNEFPDDTDLIAYLAAFYEEENQIDKAIALLEKALVNDPDDTELLFRSGIVLDKSGDKDGSIAAMKKIIEIDPDHSSALNYLGYTYADLGINLDEAEQLILRSLKIKPDDGYITDSLGWVYYKKGQYDKAIETLEKAMNLSSGDPTIAEHLGDAYKEKKNYLKALEAYKKAHSKNQNPENKTALEKKIYDMETIIKKN
ncbi:MAG: tetratricopeptide repeat protein, partial [Desulfamplus sp.]|nr:tetratricopeptide repeat protein [Desulfamplus sp.]